MTPLAHKLVKELTLPKKYRTIDDESGVIPLLADAHCFDCSDIEPMLDQLREGCDLWDFVPGDEATFLPAPRTWIERAVEYEDGTKGREGFLLLENGDASGCRVMNVRKGPDGIYFSEFDDWYMSLKSGDTASFIVPDKYLASLRGSDDLVLDVTIAELYVTLAMINTPRLIGRRQHMPHRGLERKLAAQRGLIGHFPLHAWTEIKLEIRPPKDLCDELSVEAHLTGKKALHFCRAHLRVRLGRVEIVRSHWRGDASIGIKQSRYKLVTH